MKRTIPALFLALAVNRVCAKPVKPRFIAIAESRSQLHCVDPFNSSKDWKIQLAGRLRDVQLVDNRVIVSPHNGYEKYDFQTLKKNKPVGTAGFQTLEKVKTVAAKKFRTTETILRELARPRSAPEPFTARLSLSHP